MTRFRVNERTNMENEKRFLLALALTMGFLYVWFEYFTPKPAPRKAPVQAEQSVSPGTEATAQEGAPTTGGKAVAEKKAEPTREAAKTIERENDLFGITWTNQPGAPLEMTLKNYRTEAPKDSPLTTVVPFQGDAPPPLRWDFQADGKRYSDEGATYKELLSGKRKVSYKRNLSSKLSVEKRFSWSDDNYWIDEEVVVSNRGDEAIKLKAVATLSTGETAKKKKGFGFFGSPAQPLRVSAFINEKTAHLTTSEILEEEKLPPGEIRWAGFNSQYFLLTALPVQGRWAELRASAEKGEGKGNEVERANLELVYPPYEIDGHTSQTLKLRIFAGPKDIGLLEKAGPQLDRAIDLGNWLGVIARPMLFFLRWLYSLIPNYGIAIILLTVAVRLLMFPLAQKQAKSMKRMQEHKPQMDALKAKYKDNKEAYSRELMGYMRTHKINPMGGCLLLLPQLPIFFALYRVLWNSIELRHAPFMFWVKDLAAHDPFFVLPILLGISMFMQQKMTPSPGMEPAQQKMMQMMPVFFTAIMLFLPAGLNLYIFISTLWGVVQQYWVQRQLSPVATNYVQKVSKKNVR